MPPAKTVAEFFAGIGLMRLGLDAEGWDTVYANDIDEKKKEMYEGNFGRDPGFVLGDVHTVDIASMPAVTLATASFPCNDLSLAGARKGLAGINSSAFWGFIRVLRELGERRPPLVLLENVAGFLTSNSGQDFRDALLALNDLGYAVDAFIIDAERFVPQSRVRLFVVGSQTQKPLVAAEQPSLFASEHRPLALADFILWHPEIAWCIRPLPPLPRRAASLPDLVEDVPLNSATWWNHERADYLLSQMSPRHRALADVMIASPEVCYGTVFRRVRNSRSMAELRTDGVAGCLRTPRGGSGRQILFAAGNGRFAVRLLSPRECARLMGAGDFQIAVPMNQAYFGFGDAVCVPVIQWIAREYLNIVLEEHLLPMPARTPRKNVKYGKIL